MESCAQITLQQRIFTRVETRDDRNVHVYKGDNCFLRIGSDEYLRPELDLHKQLQERGYPVATLLEEGTHGELSYYIETSFGDRVLALDCKDTCLTNGYMSDSVFVDFLAIVQRFAQAQVRDVVYSPVDIGTAVHIPQLFEEFPALEETITEVYARVLERISTLPFVFTHGDFNAFNMFPTGVIDFGDSFVGPLGYDIVSAVYHPYFFALVESEEMERQRVMWFTEVQRQQLFTMVDNIYQRQGFPAVSVYRDDFIILRGFWALANMEPWPRMQQWRRQKMERMMELYLRGISVEEVVRE